MAKRRYYQHSRRSGRSKRRYGADVPIPVLLAGLAAAVLLASFGNWQSRMELILAGVMGVILIVIGSWAGWNWWRWRRRRQRQKALQLSDIDHMHGIAFEHYVADLLKAQGATNVSVTPDKNDFGADILFDLQGTSYAAQVKRHNGFVGVAALYQASGGRDYYGKERAAVITNSQFSVQALQLAKQTGIWLVNRQTLSDWIVAFQQLE